MAGSPIYGGSYGGYLVLCALVDEPAMWRAGVDLYGDSEIAESYRHGDRLGRLDLHQMMGSPDDPARTDVYRRGSPVYRAERIEAPLLILHGRKDKRVVPLMTERMVEALEIEGKRYEVQWYDEEGHGWESARTGATPTSRILAFLKAHVLGRATGLARAHRQRDGGRDTDPDQHVADAEHVREREPGRQREDVGQRAEGGRASSTLLVVPGPMPPIAQRNRVGRHPAAVGDDRREVGAGTESR